MARWRPIKSFDKPDRHKVDVWLRIYASPRSYGWADSFRVIDAWRDDGKWMHHQDGKEMELFSNYVTHWMPIPAEPKTR